MKAASPACHAGVAGSSLRRSPFRLDLGSASVNEQFDTRDETGVIGREKQRHLSNFLGFPHASHPEGRHKSAQSRLTQFMRTFRLWEFPRYLLSWLLTLIFRKNGFSAEVADQVKAYSER